MAILILFFLPFSVLAWSFVLDLVARCRKDRERAITSDRDTVFTVLIPAHNEEACLAEVLRSLKAQTYRHYKVYIIADSCTDGTKDIAARFPDFTVIEKTGPSTCKGDALNYAIRVLGEALGDAVVVLDADCTVNAEFLSELDRAYRAGSAAVMADTDILNPSDSLISGWYTIYWKMVSEMSRRAHAKLGLSCNLCGCGMSFRREYLRETVTITEDVEYFMALGREGVRIDYAPGARVYQEQPSTLRDLFRQLYRWMSGVRRVNGMQRAGYLRSLLRSPGLLRWDAFMTSQTCSAFALYVLFVLLAALAGLLFAPQLLPAVGIGLLWFYLVTLGIGITVTRRCRLRGRIRLAAVPSFFFFMLALSLTYIYGIFFPGNTWMKVDRAKRNE